MFKLLLIVLGAFTIWILGSMGQYNLMAAHAKTEASKFDAWAKSVTPVSVEFVVSAPSASEQALYLCGSAAEMGGWESRAVPLTPGSDGNYRTTLDLLRGIDYAFRITRGSSQDAPIHTIRPDKSTTVFLPFDDPTQPPAAVTALLTSDPAMDTARATRSR